jgi:hypothetical protein
MAFDDTRAARIRDALARKRGHRELRELAGLDEAELDQAVPHPHPFAKTKLLALHWCAQHEMLHAGQIGLLRRLLGSPPLWEWCPGPALVRRFPDFLKGGP